MRHTDHVNKLWRIYSAASAVTLVVLLVGLASYLALRILGVVS